MSEAGRSFFMILHLTTFSILLSIFYMSDRVLILSSKVKQEGNTVTCYITHMDRVCKSLPHCNYIIGLDFS